MFRGDLQRGGFYLASAMLLTLPLSLDYFYMVVSLLVHVTIALDFRATIPGSLAALIIVIRYDLILRLLVQQPSQAVLAVLR